MFWFFSYNIYKRRETEKDFLIGTTANNVHKHPIQRWHWRRHLLLLGPALLKHPILIWRWKDLWLVHCPRLVWAFPTTELRFNHTAGAARECLTLALALILIGVAFGVGQLQNKPVALIYYVLLQCSWVLNIINAHIMC